MKANIYEQVTNAIVKQLEQGLVPWQKPWQNGTFMGCISHTTGKPYSLINQWLLGNRAGEWMTYGQVVAEGGHVKQGEKSSMVVFYELVQKVVDTQVTEFKDDCGEVVGTETREVIKSFPVLRAYSLFHIDQTEGIKPRYNNTAKTYDHTPIEEAERIVSDYVTRDELKLFVEDGNRAYYAPLVDEVHVPLMSQFKIAEEYYSTLFHELTHSTGHARRLNRKEVAGVSFFGDENYSKEELVAEIGAAFLCQASGIESDKAFGNSIAYLQGWLRALKNDKKMIFAAAAKAEQAAKYILNNK